MSNSISLFDLAFKPASLPLRKDQRSEKSNEGYSKTAFLFIKLVVIKSFCGSLKLAVHFHRTTI